MITYTLTPATNGYVLTIYQDSGTSNLYGGRVANQPETHVFRKLSGAFAKIKSFEKAQAAPADNPMREATLEYARGGDPARYISAGEQPTWESPLAGLAAVEPMPRNTGSIVRWRVDDVSVEPASPETGQFSAAYDRYSTTNDVTNF